MRRLIVPITALLLAGAPPDRSAALQPSRGQATLFTGARLITDGDKPPIEDSAFLVEGDRIVRVGTRSDVRGARRRRARRPERQDRDSGPRQRARPRRIPEGRLLRQGQLHAREHHQPAEAVRLLRRRRGDDRRHRCGRHQLSAARPARARRGAPAHGGTRVRHAQCRSRRSRDARRAIRRDDRRGRAEGRPGDRREEAGSRSRSGWTIEAARCRSSRRRCIARSSTKRTGTGSASWRTCSTSPTRAISSKRASTGFCIRFATRKWTMRWWRG